MGPVPHVVKKTPEDIRVSVHEVPVGPEVPWTESRIGPEEVKYPIEIVKYLRHILRVPVYTLQTAMAAAQSVGEVAKENSILAVERQVLNQALVRLEELNLAAKPLEDSLFDPSVDWGNVDLVEHLSLLRICSFLGQGAHLESLHLRHDVIVVVRPLNLEPDRAVMTPSYSLTEDCCVVIVA